MVVNRSTKRSDIWNLFDSRIRDTVTSVEIKGGTETVTVQNYANAYGDERFDSKSNYPIIVINSAKPTATPHTQTKNVDEFTLDVEVFATQLETAENLIDAIEEAILTYKPILATNGLKEVYVDDTDNDMFNRNEIKVHYYVITFKFKYYYDKPHTW